MTKSTRRAVGQPRAASRGRATVRVSAEKLKVRLPVANAFQRELFIGISGGHGNGTDLGRFCRKS